MREIIIGIWFLGAFLSIGGRSYAQCDCINSTSENEYRGSPYRSAYDELQNAEFVFIGEVVERKKAEIPEKNGYEYVIT
jgi:hypothetical protein